MFVPVLTALLLGALPLASRAGATSPAAPSTATGWVTMVSQSGDSVGQGSDYLFDQSGALTLTGTAAHVTVQTPAASGGTGFTLDFAAPAQAQLHAGVYDSVEHYPATAASSAGLAVAGDGRGCSAVYGQFDVKDIHVDSAGHVDRLWALYEQRCERATAPALFGEVRLGEPAATAPEAVEPAAVRWPTTITGVSGTDVPVMVVAGSRGAIVRAVALEGANAGDFVIDGNGCSGTTLAPGGRCQLRLAPRPSANGERDAQLTITDSGGAVTTVPLTVSGGAPTSGSGTSGGPGTPPQLPIRPVRPHRGRPDVYLQLGAARETLVSLRTHAIVGYRYFFVAQGIRCVTGATNVIFTVGRSRHIAPCVRGPILISAAVAPGKRYRVRVQAVSRHRRRTLAWGPAYAASLFMPGNEAAWKPISQLPPAF